MHIKEVRRGRRCLGLFAPFLAFIAVVGLAGCDKHEPTQLNNDLIRRTDKFFDVAHVSGNVFITVGYEGRILRSEDNGQNWQEITPRPAEWSLNQVAFVGDYGWAVGHNGTIVHTRDGGKTWTAQQSNTTKALFAVTFVDNLHGWACGDESTWLSTANGGETWEPHRIDVSQVGLSGETTLAVPDIIYYSVKFVDQQEGWLVGEYGNIRHTGDGGKTWDSQHDSLLEASGNKDVMTMGALFRVNFSDKNNGVAIGAAGTLIATNDGGKKWRWISREGQKADVPGLHLYDVVSPGQDGKLVIVGTNGTILTSENSGADWKPAKTPGGVFTWINGLAFGEGGKGVLVGGKGLILLTDDGGQSWRTLAGQKG
ncbi:MAG: hypothetical protein HY267_06530 [Deltaproteobacteria bacterium]|nr:hypothetical protein [Deltaproteobacteria bacterium]